MPRKSGPLARPTVRRVVLSDAAAARVRAEMIVRGLDYSAAAVADYVSGGILAPDDPRIVTLALTSSARELLPWIEQARAQCFNEQAARDLDQLIAALWSAANKEQ